MIRSFALRRLIRRLELVRTAMARSADSICIVDRTGQLCLVNPAAERLLDWAENELLGEDLHATLHRCTTAEASPDGPPCPLREAALAQTPFHHDEAVLRRKDGTTVPVSYLSSPLLLDGEIAATVFVFHDLTRQLQEEHDLRQSEQRYRCLAEASPEPMWLTDPYGYITVANSRAAELLGYGSWVQMVQLNSLELFQLEDRTRVTAAKRQAANRLEPATVPFTLLRKPENGTPPMPLGADVRISTVVDPDGQIIGYLFAVAQPERAAHGNGRPQRVSLPLEQAVALALSTASLPSDTLPRLLQTVCEHGGWDVGAYWHLDADDQLLRCHELWRAPGVDVPEFSSLCQQLSFPPGADLPGRAWNKNDVVWVADIVADNDSLRSLIASKEGLHAVFCFPISAGGALQGVMEFLSREVREPDAAMMKGADSASAQIGWFLERHQAEKQLRHQALHDELTGLPNRTLFLDRVRRALFVARETGKPLSLFLIDLDGFRDVNDSLGREGGDEVLIRVARRLHALLRDSDTVARLDGDEFAVLLPGTPEGGATVVAQKLVESLHEPQMVNGSSIAVGGSIGIALYPDHGQEASQLLRTADAAMCVAKREGSGFALYRGENEPRDTLPDFLRAATAMH